MNEYFILAFVVMPIVALTMGYVAMRLNEWDIWRHNERNPAE